MRQKGQVHGLAREAESLGYGEEQKRFMGLQF
jgi:hypothetical protein